MFAFLSRLGRLVIGIPIVIAITALLGFNIMTAVPTASHHRDAATAACTLAGSTVGGALVLSGSGYSPGANYVADFLWPNGTSGGFPTTADTSGNIRVSTYAWWAGTYTANVMTAGANSHLMASCSATAH